MDAYMYICINLCTYIYTFTYIHTCIDIYTYIHSPATLNKSNHFQSITPPAAIFFGTFISFYIYHPTILKKYNHWQQLTPPAALFFRTISFFFTSMTLHRNEKELTANHTPDLPPPFFSYPCPGRDWWRVKTKKVVHRCHDCIDVRTSAPRVLCNMCVCVHAQIYIYVHIYVHVCVCVCVCVCKFCVCVHIRR